MEVNKLSCLVETSRKKSRVLTKLIKNKIVFSSLSKFKLTKYMITMQAIVRVRLKREKGGLKK